MFPSFSPVWFPLFLRLFVFVAFFVLFFRIRLNLLPEFPDFIRFGKTILVANGKFKLLGPIHSKSECVGGGVLKPVVH